MQASFDTHTRVGTLEWLNNANLGGEGVLKLTASSSLDPSDLGKKMPVSPYVCAPRLCPACEVKSALSSLDSKVSNMLRTWGLQGWCLVQVRLGRDQQR